MESRGERALPLALVVDDEELVRMVVCEALEQSGLHVCEASNGHQALEAFAANRPDIVVLDIMLQGLDGFAICARRSEERRVGKECRL